MKTVEIYNNKEAELISQLISYPVLIEAEFNDGTLGGAILMEDAEKFKMNVYYIFDMFNVKHTIVHWGNANKIYDSLEQMVKVSDDFRHQTMQCTDAVNSFVAEYEAVYNKQLDKRQMDYTKMKLDTNRVLKTIIKITTNLSKVNEIWTEQLNALEEKIKE